MDSDKEQRKKEILEDFYEKVDFNSNYNSSIGKISNWLLGIAIGLFTLTLYELNKSLDGQNVIYNKAFIILTMLNLGYSGFIRHAIYVQEFRMNFFFDELKKLVYFDKLSISKEEFRNQFKKLTNQRLMEYNKTIEIHKWININTYSTVVILVLFGILILNK